MQSKIHSEMQHVVKKDVLNFIFAGNSLFTVVNSQTGNRFTFHVTKPKEKSKEVELRQIHFVRVLTNPDIYEFIGTCFDQKFSLSKKSRFSAEAQSVRVFTWLITQLQKNALPDFIQVWHHGRCGKCGRVLTVPSSIELGIGPECIKTLTNKAMLRAKKLLELNIF